MEKKYRITLKKRQAGQQAVNQIVEQETIDSLKKIGKINDYYIEEIEMIKLKSNLPTELKDKTIKTEKND